MKKQGTTTEDDIIEKDSVVSFETEPTEENEPSSRASTKSRVRTISDKAKNKIVRLFTYLEKALALDDSIVRDFRTTTTAPSPWWLADYPRDVENLYIRPFDAEKVADNLQIGAWLKVEKKSIKPAPNLPNELIGWINEVNPADTPTAKEKIDRNVRFDDDNTRISDFKKFRKEYEQGDVAPESISDWVVLSPDKLPEAIEVKYVEDKGYQVLPEYPVIGRRIDLVVQGENARLAIECDGDQCHTLENFEADWNRQRQIERAGWVFWRVAGSAFYCHKEKALDSLWKKLEELGIKPII